MKKPQCSKALCWTAELVALILVAGLFWQANVYLGLCIFIFHGLSMLQIFKTQHLIGTKQVVVSLKQRILAAVFVLIIGFAVGADIFRRGIPMENNFNAISVEQTVELANGEVFPFIVMLAVLSALLMFGLTTEGRKR